MARFRFLFDSRGKRLEYPPSPDLRAAAAAPQAAAPAAEAAPHAMDGVTIVNELQRWLEGNAAFGLDMGILEDREVLTTPPQWSSVSKAAKSLASNEVADPAAIDGLRQTVETYVRMLEQRAVILNEALASAAFASVGSMASEPAARLADGLKALPKGGRVPDLLALPGVLALPAVPMPTSGARQWAEAIRKQHEAIVAAMRERDWEEVESTAWERWRKRLGLYRRRPQDFGVDSTDLLLRARNAGPAALFQNELTKMPLRKWFEALLATVHGAPEPSVLAIPGWVRDAVVAELLGERRSLLLIAGESVASPTAHWLPSRKNGCLWVDRARWFALLGALPPFLRELPWMIAIEVSGEPQTLSLAVRLDPRATYPPPMVPLPASVFHAYLGKDKLPPTVTPVVPYVENARDVDDAVSKIESMMRTASRPSPT